MRIGGYVNVWLQGYWNVSSVTVPNRYTGIIRKYISSSNRIEIINASIRDRRSVSKFYRDLYLCLPGRCPVNHVRNQGKGIIHGRVFRELPVKCCRFIPQKRAFVQRATNLRHSRRVQRPNVHRHLPRRQRRREGLIRGVQRQQVWHRAQRPAVPCSFDDGFFHTSPLRAEDPRKGDAEKPPCLS